MAGFKIEYLVEFRGTGMLSRRMVEKETFTTIYDWSKPQDLANFFIVLHEMLKKAHGEYELLSITKLEV